MPGELTLLAAEGSTMRIHEKILQDPQNTCVKAVTIDFSRASDGDELFLTWEPGFFGGKEATLRRD
ncbi:hypothetical protein ACH49_28930 [Streptomyces leeuwenhoekii]|uniref:Uncharacterized protein n=1 Tax=Streptomyces leeuwenhoekii TaxID=1437453 RepID=A0ABR5HQS7_STRLW|nr:hypothetical protein ACH49_28930 [Streptomyces leeuwenhoekii]